ncbi:MAG: hypothetical protein P4M14_11525 [Gammaproteobacteria bacterium]|nr:hypothetical protein [Gammaproteobacteria bacterium]
MALNRLFHRVTHEAAIDTLNKKNSELEAKLAELTASIAIHEGQEKDNDLFIRVLESRIHPQPLAQAIADLGKALLNFSAPSSASAASAQAKLSEEQAAQREKDIATQTALKGENIKLKAALQALHREAITTQFSLDETKKSLSEYQVIFEKHKVSNDVVKNVLNPLVIKMQELLEMNSGYLADPKTQGDTIVTDFNLKLENFLNASRDPHCSPLSRLGLVEDLLQDISAFKLLHADDSFHSSSKKQLEKIILHCDNVFPSRQVLGGALRELEEQNEQMQTLRKLRK